MHNLKEQGLLAFGKDAKERVENAIVQLQNNRGVILIDDEDRENEGDLIFNAASMTTNDMALLIRESSGIVCICVLEDRARQLELPYMVKENTSRHQTPFTISVDAKEGITTGVSAKDRIKTIQVMCDDNSIPADLSKPGHMFPLIANSNGVLSRNGHTEGSVDLMRLSNLKPIAVLCELMNEDGTMQRLPQILDFAKAHQFVVVSIEDIIYYRKFVSDYTAHEKTIEGLHC